MQDVLLMVVAGGTLFNAWRIARSSGRVDALESAMRTSLAAESPKPPGPRNAPNARDVPAPAGRRNRTVLGPGRGSVIVRTSLVDPLIPPDDWEMPGPR